MVNQSHRETPFATLQTDRVLLKPITHDDTPFIMEHFTDPAVNRYLHDEGPPTPEQAAAIVDFYVTANNPSYNRWIAMRKEDGISIGTCGFHKWSKQHHCAEIGYDLSPLYQGQGYMTEAVRAMLNHGFNHLNLHRIEAMVSVDNERSVKLLQRLGLKREGILRDYFYNAGRYHDQYLFAMLRDDHDQYVREAGGLSIEQHA